MEKRALSPVITTVLLILVAIILALLIWFWARSAIGEQISKFDGNSDRPIDEVCNLVNLKVEKSETTKLLITNQGDISVYKVAYKQSDAGSTQVTESEELNILPGGSKTINVGDNSKITSIAFVLLGKNEENGEVAYRCKFWKDLA